MDQLWIGHGTLAREPEVSGLGARHPGRSTSTPTASRAERGRRLRWGYPRDPGAARSPSRTISRLGTTGDLESGFIACVVATAAALLLTLVAHAPGRLPGRRSLRQGASPD